MTDRSAVIRGKNRSGRRPDPSAEGLRHFGRLDDCSAAASLTGPCGEEMEFYLRVDNRERISCVRFYSRGCPQTCLCGETAAAFAEGKSLEEALFISPGMILARMEDLGRDHHHCAVLAVSTLYRALACYLTVD